MPTYEVRCTQCTYHDEIEKPREAALPRCPTCGAQLRQVYRAPAMHINQETRFERMVGPARFARFKAQRDDAEQRARRGRLTAYERTLETI